MARPKQQPPHEKILTKLAELYARQEGVKIKYTVGLTR